MFKIISNFENYSINKEGQIWSKTTNKFKSHVNLAHGYKGVQLWKENKPTMKSIHRLLLETYVGPCPDGMEGCHNNGVRNDNRLDNLRWDTHSSNMQDAVRHGTHAGLFNKGENHGASKITNIEVNQIRSIHNLYQKEIAELFNISQQHVSDIINHRRRNK